jgi:eukaryotic-like serine/threonine-protein kinase
MFLPVPALKRPADLPPVPPLLERLRVELLSKQAKQRPASAAEVRRRLREALDPARGEALLPGRKGDAVSDRAARLPSWEEAPKAAPPTQVGGRVGWLSLAAPPAASAGELALGLAAQQIHLQALDSPEAAGHEPLDALVIDAGGEAARATALLGKLAASPLGKRVLVCLRSPDMPTINQMIAAGAADVLPYPVTPEGLARRLQRMLRRRR